MKFSKEVRIGLLVAASFLIFFAGFYFLKGANIFSGENKYYAYYDDVQGLQPSSSVQVKGLGVGQVSKIELIESGKVKVTFAISKKINVNKGSVAIISAADLLGTKVIRLELGTGPKLEDESVLPGEVEGGVIDNISTEITPLIQDVRHVVASLDTVLAGINSMLDPVTRARLQNSVASLDVTMQNFSSLSAKLNKESESLANVMRNANSITSNIASNNERINNIIKNVEVTADNLSKSQIDKAVKDLNEAINEVQGVIRKVNSNQGSLGLLVNDKQLYNNLTQSLTTLNTLMLDINKHPSRYINVSIFGRKNKD